MDELRWTTHGVPVLGIAGESRSGKTTLLEALIPRFTSRGLRIGVLKHAGHPLTIDQPGKDTDRLFRAGAVSVQAQDPVQRFSRQSLAADDDWRDALAAAPADLDLLLVEGYKHAPIAQIPVDPDVDRVEADIADWLVQTWSDRPTGVLLLEGGYAGVGDDPKVTTKLPPVPGIPEPLSLLLAAFRWLPDHAWVIAPTVDPGAVEAVRKLILARRPGAWSLTEPPLTLVEPQLQARAEKEGHHTNSRRPELVWCPPFSSGDKPGG